MKRLLPFAYAALLAAPAAADEISDFYSGKQIRLVISSTPGGGYDLYARTISRYISKHLPGSPVIVTQNMPGAGGVVAGNHLFAAASKDGLTIGLLQNTVPFEPMMQNKQALFDSTKFLWLGSPSQEVAMLAVWHTVPVNSLEEATKRELVLGASGVNSTPAFFSRIENAVFGTKIRLIAGYPSQTESFLGMERGENDGYGSVFWSSLKSTKPDWVRDKKMKLLVQFGAKPHPELPGVPFAPDVAKTPEDKALVELAAAPLAVGRPFLAPPDLPPARGRALRAAFTAALADADFLADCAKAKLECDSPVTGEETEAILKRAYSAPPAVVDKLRQIYEAEK